MVTLASPIGERAADLDAEPVEQGALDQHHAGERQAAPASAGSSDRDLAIERVGVVDGLHLDQRALAGMRRGPWRGSSPIRSTWPSASSAARSSALAWRLISSKERSPPIKRRPCRVNACSNEAASEPIAATAATPRAMQSTNTVRPPAPASEHQRPGPLLGQATDTRDNRRCHGRTEGGRVINRQRVVARHAHGTGEGHGTAGQGQRADIGIEGDGIGDDQWHAGGDGTVSQGQRAG